MPLISVIMPTYKVEEYLPQCLESVINQDFEDIEIIPVDDGSPDRCGSIIDDYAKKDRRIHPIHQKNGGYGKAVNAGMKQANGKYIAIVETDDYIEPDMLSSLYSVAEKYEVPVAKAGFKKLYDNGDEFVVKPPCRFYTPEIVIEPIYKIDFMLMESSIWSALYRKDFLEKNEITMLETSGAAYQDLIFKFMVYAAAKKIGCIEKAVYNYRVMTANSSSKSSKNWDIQFKNYEVIKEWLVKHQKFEILKDAFYTHAYFDFLFHYNRLNEEGREKFLKKAKLFYEEGMSVGIGADNVRLSNNDMRNYYYGEIYPFLIKLGKPIEKVDTLKINEVQYWRNKTKDGLRKIYHTKIGNKCWNKINALIHRPFIWNKIHEGSEFYVENGNIDNRLMSLDFADGIFELETIKDDKRVLVILPWYQKNAVIHNIERIARALKKIGYQLHLYLYWEWYSPNGINREVWDRVFYQHSKNPYFGHTNSSKERMDGDKIDDWIDDDFLQSIVRLNDHYHYSICIANYLFYTKAFEILPTSVKKILYTHDKFANRNKSLHAAGYPEWSFWFGVESEKEEARALLRSDVVLAIQENDAEYFRRITNDRVKVITFPFLPEKVTVEHRTKINEVITVGYIASSNPPNYFSIMKLIESIKKVPNLHLYIGGSICSMISSTDIPASVTILGTVDSLEEFYSSYDIYVNPDTFYSGLKCKTLEAISYGVGIVCTEVAGTGMNLEAEYHMFNSEAECGKYLEEFSKKTKNEKLETIQKMRKESEIKYEEFCHKYQIDKLTVEMLS
jgi:glycosyltransferase involved in cell wall biosynthesis